MYSIFYPPLSSAFIAAMSAANCVMFAQAGLSEARGNNMGYSKFSPSSDDGKQLRLRSRDGMLLIYTPALAAAAAAFGIPGVVVTERCRLLCLALLLHFFKRDFEVLFIHQYSGQIPVESAITISLSYFMSTSIMIYSQYLTQFMQQEPTLDLKYAGVVVFLVGICGNLYHHYLLSKLREKGAPEEESKAYKIPKGGLFGLVICPHYLFEVIGFMGISLISQTLFAFSVMVGTVFYLMGRSYATRKWYLSKFPNFPKQVKALIPYVF
ncbi:3-oxo-5-alpha-steroid 4-dehydrogenase 2-like [Canna indica]|uniref:3-oxo-5-alpha-steroid 4-dehydrogenase 2-like n=1 Tax=Canna indica TaxID=4628 RepID=A0AAQ3Q5H7_9LILI|nr:3-oxo-5-alpha-steroid 4-dehydrogenase 2-like [Canna indica]